MTWNERGSATVENIVWFPLLLMIFAAIVQFGLIFNARNAVQAASFEAARQAVVSDEPTSQAESAVYNFARGILPGWKQGQRVKARVLTPDGVSPGASVTVNVSYDVPVFFAGLLPKLETSPGIFTVKGNSTMMIEEKP